MSHTSVPFVFAGLPIRVAFFPTTEDVVTLPRTLGTIREADGHGLFTILDETDPRRVEIVERFKAAGLRMDGFTEEEVDLLLWPAGKPE